MKTSLRWYDHTRDQQIQGGRGNWRASDGDETAIRARAKVKIIEDAGGFLIGTGRHNVNRITEDTGVQSLDVDSMSLIFIFANMRPNFCAGIVDKEGLLTVHIAGDVIPVLKAVHEVHSSLRPHYVPNENLSRWRNQ